MFSAVDCSVACRAKARHSSPLLSVTPFWKEMQPQTDHNRSGSGSTGPRLFRAAGAGLIVSRMDPNQDPSEFDIGSFTMPKDPGIDKAFCRPCRTACQGLC